MVLTTNDIRMLVKICCVLLILIVLVQINTTQSSYMHGALGDWLSHVWFFLGQMFVSHPELGLFTFNL